MQSLAGRIGGVFLVVATVGCAVAGFAATTVTVVTGEVRHLLDRDTAIAIAVLRTQNHIIRLGSSLAGELAAPSPDGVRLHRHASDRLRDYADRLAEMRAAGAAGVAEAARLQPGFARLSDATQAMLARADAGEIGQARALYATDLAPLLEQHATLTRTRVEVWMRDLKDRRAAVMQAASRARLMMLGAAAIPALAAMLATLWIYGPGLRRPLRRLAAATDTLRRGEYDAPITGFRRRDEIGALAAILEQLRHEARQTRRLEQQARAREAEAEAGRLRALTNAAFEGILICDGDRVTEANTSLADMAGMPRGEIVGAALDDLLRLEDGGSMREAVEAADGRPVPAQVVGPGGAVPVELCVRRLIGRGGGSHVILTARDLREQRAVEQQVRFLATHDPITGLANQTTLRRELERALEAARAAGESIAIVAIDFDKFRRINDLHGHRAGDTVLRAAAHRMLACAGDADRVARLGGDEFAIMQRGAVQPAAGERLAQQVLDHLGEAFGLVGGKTAVLSAAAGVAVAPRDADTADALLTFSQLALARAKAVGGWRMFSPEMNAEQQLRGALEGDLRAALPEGQFWLAYQPQALTGDGVVIGFEVLLRWNHPTRGVVPPGHFIPLAESLGLIPELGAWVLRTACHEAATWNHPLRVAVNVSPLQLERGDFATLVEHTLAESGLAPSRLEVEITESTLIRDGPTTLRMMRALRALGVTIALDDFGTGYSSLSTLHNFPFDRVKVDRGFVSDMPGDMRATAIVRAVVALGHSLGLPVIAEGVESEAQRAALVAEGCDEIQGYLIGKPRPIAACASLIGGRISLRAEGGVG